MLDDNNATHNRLIHRMDDLIMKLVVASSRPADASLVITQEQVLLDMENPTLTDPTLTDIVMLTSPPDEFEGEFDSYEDEEDDDEDYEDLPATGDFDFGKDPEPASKDDDDDDLDDDVESYDDNDDPGDFDDDDDEGDLF